MKNYYFNESVIKKMTSTELKTKNFWLMSDDDMSEEDGVDTNDKDAKDDASENDSGENLYFGPNEKDLDEAPMDIGDEEDAE